jgi:hypothetical protein
MAGQSYGLTINIATLGEGEFAKLGKISTDLAGKSSAFDNDLSRLAANAKKTKTELSNLANFNGDFNLGDIGDIAPTLPFEKQINKSIDSIKQKIQGLTGINLKTNDAQSNIEALKAKLTQLQGQRNLSLNTADIRKANGDVKKLEAEIKRLENLPPNGIFDKFSKLRSSISPMAGLVAGAFAFSSMMDFGGQIVKVTSEFQKYNAVLTNSFGNQTLANQAMKDLQDLSAKTPFQLNNLTESYVKLVNRGFVPTMAEMTKLGDLASSTGKDFDQLVEAVLDAETGEMERLKEFGIQADKNKDKVSFTFKGITKTVKNEASAIRGYLLGLGDLKGVQGSMSAISGTIGGQLSNLSDGFDAFKLKLGQGLEPIIKIGIMVTNKLLSMGSALADKVMPYVSEFATFINQNMPMVKDMLKGAGIAVGILTGAMVLLNITMLANPIVWIGGLIVGLIGLFGYAYATSEDFRGAMWGLWEAGKVVFNGLRERVKSFVVNVWESLKGLGNLLQGIFTLDFEQIKTGFGQLATGIGSFAKDLFTNTVDIGTGVGKAYTEGVKGGLADFAQSQEANKLYKQNAIENQISADQKANAEKKQLEDAQSQGFGLPDLIKYNQSGAEGKGQSLLDFMNSGGGSNPSSMSSGASTGGKGSKSGLGAGISEIKSDAGVVNNITINVEAMIKEVNFNKTEVKQGVNETLGMLKQGLLAVVNDVNTH